MHDLLVALVHLPIQPPANLHLQEIQPLARLGLVQAQRKDLAANVRDERGCELELRARERSVGVSVYLSSSFRDASRFSSPDSVSLFSCVSALSALTSAPEQVPLTAFRHTDTSYSARPTHSCNDATLSKHGDMCHRSCIARLVF